MASKVETAVKLLRQYISSKAFQSERLPSEPDLARQLNTSRATVRQALAELESENLILRKHGSGTYVNAEVAGIQTRLEEVWDFDEMIRIAGYRPGVQNQWVALEPAGEKYAGALSLAPGDEVLCAANVFLANNTPVIYCLDVIPARLVASAYRETELHGPVYTFLKQRCEQELDHNVTRVLPVTANQELANLLACEPGSPLHYFEETGYSTARTPVIYSEEYYRPEYFDFKVVRKMTTQERSR